MKNWVCIYTCYFTYFSYFREPENPQTRVATGFLLGLLERFIGTFGTFYWDFWNVDNSIGTLKVYK